MSVPHLLPLALAVLGWSGLLSNIKIVCPFVNSIWNKLVLCNDLFYCQSLTGWAGVFNPHERTWGVLSVPPPKWPKKFFAKNWWKGKFLTEKDGDILVIYTCATDNSMVFKLDQRNMVWEELKTMDGATIFASVFCKCLDNSCKDEPEEPPCNKEKQCLLL